MRRGWISGLIVDFRCCAIYHIFMQNIALALLLFSHLYIKSTHGVSRPIIKILCFYKAFHRAAHGSTVNKRYYYYLV